MGAQREAQQPCVSAFVVVVYALLFPRTVNICGKTVGWFRYVSLSIDPPQVFILRDQPGVKCLLTVCPFLYSESRATELPCPFPQSENRLPLPLSPYNWNLLVRPLCTVERTVCAVQLKAWQGSKAVANRFQIRSILASDENGMAPSQGDSRINSGAKAQYRGTVGKNAPHAEQTHVPCPNDTEPSCCIRNPCTVCQQFSGHEDAKKWWL